ncbi:MAG: hypothetical protein AAFP15_14695, partial [Bacteroidota bacterium]
PARFRVYPHDRTTRMIAPHLLTPDVLVRCLRQLGYPLPRPGADGPGRVLPVGVRSENTEAGAFDDAMGILVCEPDGEFWSQMEVGTVDPGVPHMLRPINPRGCGIICEGFHQDIWTRGLHKGRQRALIQRGAPIRVYRDDTRDTVLDFDPGTVEAGWFGANWHTTAGRADEVGLWSAMCPVTQNPVLHAAMMDVAYDSPQERFSLAVLTSLQVEAAFRHEKVRPYQAEVLS